MFRGPFTLGNHTFINFLLHRFNIIDTLDLDIDQVDPIGNRYADIVFPAATWGEDTFMRANGERRLRLYNRFYDPPGEAKPDWWIIANLAKRMGFDGFDWKDSNDVAEESATTIFTPVQSVPTLAPETTSFVNVWKAVAWLVKSIVTPSSRVAAPSGT